MHLSVQHWAGCTLSDAVEMAVMYKICWITRMTTFQDRTQHYNSNTRCFLFEKLLKISKIENIFWFIAAAYQKDREDSLGNRVHINLAVGKIGTKKSASALLNETTKK